MCASNVEELISDLDPEVSKIYFDAKDVLVNANDSNNERFSAAARIVRAFWKRVASTHRRYKDTHSKVVPIHRMF
jgi:hypothetical protein